METPIYSSHPHRLLLLLLHLIKGFKAMASFLYFLTHYSVPCFLFMHKAMFLLFLALCFLVSFYLMSSFFHLFLSLSLSHTHAYTHAIFMNSAEKDLKIMCMCIHNVQENHPMQQHGDAEWFFCTTDCLLWGYRECVQQCFGRKGNHSLYHIYVCVNVYVYVYEFVITASYKHWRCHYICPVFLRGL